MAVDMFLKIDGIKGEIEVLSFSWGATQQGVLSSGGAGRGGKVVMQDFHFVHRVDATSPQLLNAACSGKSLGSASLSFVKIDQIKREGQTGGAFEFLKVKLDQILIGLLQPVANQGDDGVYESVSLNFSKMTTTYYTSKGEAVEASSC